MPRRLIAVMLATLTLQLSAGSALLACGERAAEVAATSAPGHEGHSDHSTLPQSDAPAPGEDGEPSHSSCCQAMVSCAPSAWLADVRDAALAQMVRDAALTVAERIPASRLPAPEPPPPRV